ncbi:MAG: dUTP diphosphatase [Candidatus Caldatribacteriota bacterium]
MIKKQSELCKVENCENLQKTMGYCGKHYQQMQKYGKIISINNRTNRDPNEFIIEDNITRIVLYDRLGNVTVETIIDTDIIEYISQYKWYLANTNYVVSDYKEDGVRKQMALHRAVMYIKDNFKDYNTCIDHKDSNTLNNTFSNLRKCSVSQNMMNSKKQKWGSSKFKGVFWNNHAKKWQAQIMIDSKLIILGRTNDEIEAAKLYNIAALQYFGEFANLNNISNKLSDNEIIHKIFEKQNNLNVHTNGPDWKTLKLPWYRAWVIECFEIMEYLPWKWWKKSKEINLEQIKLEVIDILHFGVSNIIESEKLIDNKIDFIINSFKYYKINTEPLEKQIENFVLISLETKQFDIACFVKICKSLEMNIHEIYKLYIGKNILNKFRQNHGYKQNQYIKIWNGKEDNTYLMSIIEKIDINENFETEVYNQLEEQYKQIKN